jgi:phage gp37-like protein
MSRMDSTKTRFDADSSAVLVARLRITHPLAESRREAVCGRYLAFATREVLRGRRALDLADRALAQAGLADAPFGRRRLRQR